MNDPIDKKLLISESGKSLISELKLYELCSEIKTDYWKLNPSEFYIDPFENKIREIDLVMRRTIELDNILINIVIPIEVKSNRDHHLIYINNYEFDQSFKFNCDIIGKSFRNTQFLILEKFNKLASYYNFKKDILKYFINEIVETSDFYGGHDKIQIPSIDKAEFVLFSSFRETNSSKDKDLDNSVFWKALKSLDSFTKSQLKIAQEEFVENIIESIPLKIIPYEAEEERILRNSFKKIFSEIKPSIFLFHKVIVIGSRIWEVVDENNIIEKASGRFIDVQNGKFKSWCDVVNDSHIENYIKTLLKEYNTIIYEKYEL
jgi:hypothetical protein